MPDVWRNRATSSPFGGIIVGGPPCVMNVMPPDLALRSFLSAPGQQ